jgi:uncharacterized protein
MRRQLTVPAKASPRDRQGEAGTIDRSDDHPPCCLVPLRRTFVGRSINEEDAVRYKMVDERPKTFVLVFETNDELSQGLKKFASEQKLASASFKAIGALSSVKLGWLSWETKKYEPSVSLDEQVELLSLSGHLLQANVRPTCELVLTERPAHLKKEFDPAAGIALIKL